VPADRRQLTGGLASRSVKPFQTGSETGPTKLKAGYIWLIPSGPPWQGPITVVGLTSPKPDERPPSLEAASFVLAIGASARPAALLAR
jgi:hypothetical protein